MTTSVLITQAAHSRVFRIRQRRPERLVAAVDHDQEWLVDALRVVVEQTEQPVMMSTWPVDAELEPARHVALHRLPVATAREPLGGADATATSAARIVARTFRRGVAQEAGLQPGPFG